MKREMSAPGIKVECPDNCRYRNKLAPFCGYCMLEILNKNDHEEERNDSRKEERT